MQNPSSLQSDLRALANPKKATVLSRFFKTGKGAYGEGDQFLGIVVPDTRRIVKKYSNVLKLEDVETLLHSPYHEERLAGVLTLVDWQQKGILPVLELAEFYMSHVDRINNWDLVDTSAPQIIGPYIEMLDREERENFIEHCIRSDHLWTNRIIVLATFYHIKELCDATLILQIVPRFLTHPHDLMHKACGWMLREVGKRVSESILLDFLDTYSQRMPRTMLRYAIERLDAQTRQYYMHR